MNERQGGYCDEKDCLSVDSARVGNSARGLRTADLVTLISK